MSFWASLQIHFLPFNLSVSSQPKIWISQNLWCNNLRRLNLLCCTDFGTWKGIKSTEIDKNILNWHNTEICQFLRNTPDWVAKMKRKPEYFGSGCNYIRGVLKKGIQGGGLLLHIKKYWHFLGGKDFLKRSLFIDLVFGGFPKICIPMV